MSAQRRDTDRKAAESVDRIWQIYADEIGIPKVGEAEAHESSLPPSDDVAQLPRPARAAVESLGRPLVAVGVVVVVGVAGIALWRGSPRTPDAGDHRPTTVASAPAGDVGRMKPSVNPAPPSSPAVRPGSLNPSPLQPAGTRPVSKDAIYRVNFDFGSDRITDESKPTLDRMAAAMKANRDWRVVIEGHTDTRGTAEYNRELSERRALAVKAYLQSTGIAPERLSAAGFGASRPAAPGDARGDVINRRVDLHRR
jgi:outer membrane protein OmpA-like peptidoglycan-associated protein